MFILPKGIIWSGKKWGLRDPKIYVTKIDSLGIFLWIYGVKFWSPLTPTFFTIKWSHLVIWTSQYGYISPNILFLCTLKSGSHTGLSRLLLICLPLPFFKKLPAAAWILSSNFAQNSAIFGRFDAKIEVSLSNTTSWYPSFFCEGLQTSTISICQIFHPCMLW